MQTLFIPGVVLLLAAGPAGAPAYEAATPPGGHPPLPAAQITGSPEEDDACEAVIETQDWAKVLEVCEPLLAVHDSSHRLYDFIKENVEYAHSTLNYENQQGCLTAAQGADWGTVLATCPATIEAFPEFIAGHFFVGMAHQASGAPAEANAAFESLIAEAAANPQIGAQLTDQIALAQKQAGINYIEMGNTEAGVPLLRLASESSPEDAEVHFRLGFALLQADDDAGAEAAFSTVIELNPDIPQMARVLFRAGILAWNAQDYENANERLSRYIEAEPEGDNALEAHWLLGSIGMQNNNQNQVITHFRAFLDAAASDDPRRIEAAYNLGNIYYNRNQCDSALRYYQQFLRAAPRDQRAGDVQDLVLDIEDGLCEPLS